MTLIDVFLELPFSGNASINNLHSCVAQVMIDGAKTVSNILSKLGIRHSLVGGMAVSCNGYPRTTSKIDFAVGDCAFEYHDKLTSLRVGLPVKYMGVRVNYLVFSTALERSLLDQYLTVPISGEVPVLPVGPLIVLKLLANRLKDRSDIGELLKRRSTDEIAAIVKFVADNLPSQSPLLAELIVVADNERTYER